MKKIILVFLVALLSGCSHLSYEKDGTKVAYSRLFGELSNLNAMAGGATISVGSAGVDQQAFNKVLQQVLVDALLERMSAPSGQ